MPELPSVTGGFHKVLPAARAIAEVERASDVAIVQLPFAAPLALLGPRGPRVYHLCMDQPAYVRTSTAYSGAAKLAAVAAADGFELLHHGLLRARGARIVTHGDVLLERFGPSRGRSVVSSSVLDAEIGAFSRSRPAGAPFRVLFVGYLREEKGFDVLLEAFEGLGRRVPGAELVIVGAREAVDRGASDRIERMLAAVSSRARVELAGHKSFGPELFQCYADADVLVLPTRSEGTPRVLVEARAHGCPIVASRVGGIPSSVREGEDGLLVRPGDVWELEEAMVRIATDSALRARLIRGGYARAREHSVERFAAAILEEAERALRSGRG